MDKYIVRYSVLDATSVFNYIGPDVLGTAINHKLRLDNNKIQERNKRDNFYNNLEKSILEEGFRNPIIVSAGWTSGGIYRNLPKEIQDKGMRNLVICHQLGGSRLYIAQKHRLQIPCIIKDYSNVFRDLPVLDNEESIRILYKDQPTNVICTGEYLRIEWPGHKI